LWVALKLAGEMLVVTGASVALVGVAAVRSVMCDEECLFKEILKAFFLALAGAGGDPDVCRFLPLLEGAKPESSSRVSGPVKAVHSR
jgi:hypothetical protein